MLDVVCAHATGCDLVIAAGCDLSVAPAPGAPFNALSEIGTAINHAIPNIHERARREFPNSPETEGLLALMTYQALRTLPGEMPVGMLCPPQSQGFAVGLQAHTMICPEGCSSKSSRVGGWSSFLSCAMLQIHGDSLCQL